MELYRIVILGTRKSYGIGDLIPVSRNTSKEVYDIKRIEDDGKEGYNLIDAGDKTIMIIPKSYLTAEIYYNE